MNREELINAVEKYRATLFRVAYGHIGNYQDAEDICQDVFLKLLKSSKQFKDEEHMKAWLIRVAINASKSVVRSSWRNKREESFPEDAPYYCDVAERELFDCVMRLPEKYRTAVYLFYYEDYPIEEVAKMMGLSKSSVSTRLNRAREELKRTYVKGEVRCGKQYQESI
jgi:RNA polymerase sigma-70 factor (ECF subfamily)